MEYLIIGLVAIVSGIIGRAIGYRQGVARGIGSSYLRRWLGVGV